MRVYLNEAFRALDVPFTAPRAGDAGYDLYATAEATLAPQTSAVIPTGVHVELPAGFVGIIKDRSSMALKGVHTYGGVIDAGYRGEIRIILNNLSGERITIARGQKFAQMIVVPVYGEPVEVMDTLAELTETTRGERGFGSTGI